MKLSIDPVLARRIGRIAAPIVGAMITQTLINQADHIMVGRLPPEESVDGQAAVQTSLQLLWMVGGFLSAIGVGTQALVGRRHGQGDHDGAARVLTSSVMISAVLGISASIVFRMLAPTLFPVVSPIPGVIKAGVPFLKWRYTALLAMAVTASYKSFFDGIGHTHVHLVVAVVMNLLNLVLNFCLIYGMGGLPRLGVEGSGIASCISSYVGMLLIIGWSFRPQLKAYRFYHVDKISGKVMREIGRLSLPSGIAVIASLSGFGVFYKVVAQLDVAAGHVHGIYSSANGNLISVFMLIFISGIAFGQGVSTLVGQSMGARDFDAAKHYAYEAAKIGFVAYGLLGLVMVAAPDAVLHVFCKDQPVVEVAAPLLRVVAMFAPLMSIALVFMYALYGAGNSRFVMIVELILHFSCLIPISYVLAIPLGGGLWGAWAAMIAYVVLMAVIMWWKFREGAWRHIHI